MNWNLEPEEARDRIEDITGRTATLIGEGIWLSEEIDPIQCHEIDRRVSPEEVAIHNGSTEIQV